MNSKSLLSITILAAVGFLTACSPDDVPAGGNPPLEPTVNGEVDSSKLSSDEPLQVLGQFNVKMIEEGQVDPLGVEIESQTTSYQCTAIMEDQLKRSGSFCARCSQQPYRLMRYYSFSLTHEQRAVQLANLEYRKLALVGNGTYEVNQELSLESPNAEIKMAIYSPETELEDDDFIKLDISPSQKIGKYIVRDRQSSMHGFNQQQITGSTALDLQYLVKKSKDFDPDRDGAIPVEGGELVIESGKGVDLKLETFQVKTPGTVKVQVSCALN